MEVDSYPSSLFTRHARPVPMLGEGEITPPSTRRRHDPSTTSVASAGSSTPTSGSCGSRKMSLTLPPLDIPGRREPQFHFGFADALQLLADEYDLPFFHAPLSSHFTSLPVAIQTYLITSLGNALRQCTYQRFRQMGLIPEDAEPIKHEGKVENVWGISPASLKEGKRSYGAVLTPLQCVLATINVSHLPRAVQPMLPRFVMPRRWKEVAEAPSSLRPSTHASSLSVPPPNVADASMPAPSSTPECPALVMVGPPCASRNGGWVKYAGAWLPLQAALLRRTVSPSFVIPAPSPPKEPHGKTTDDAMEEAPHSSTRARHQPVQAQRPTAAPTTRTTDLSRAPSLKDSGELQPPYIVVDQGTTQHWTLQAVEFDRLCREYENHHRLSEAVERVQAWVHSTLPSLEESSGKPSPKRTLQYSPTTSPTCSSTASDMSEEEAASPTSQARDIGAKAALDSAIGANTGEPFPKRQRVVSWHSDSSGTGSTEDAGPPPGSGRYPRSATPPPHMLAPSSSHKTAAPTAAAAAASATAASAPAATNQEYRHLLATFDYIAVWRRLCGSNNASQWSFQSHQVHFELSPSSFTPVLVNGPEWALRQQHRRFGGLPASHSSSAPYAGVSVLSSL